MTNIDFRIAQAEDAQAITDLVNSVYRGESAEKSWTSEAHFLGGQRTDKDAISELIQKPKTYILLAVVNNEILGCVLLESSRDHDVKLGMLSVALHLQNKGLGKILLNYSEDYCLKQLHAKSISMNVFTNRPELLAYYFRRGYHDTGLRQPFPTDNPRLGLPKISNLEFAILKKDLTKTD